MFKKREVDIHSSEGICFLDFPEDRWRSRVIIREPHPSAPSMIRERFPSALSMLAEYLEYRKKAKKLVEKYPQNLIVILLVSVDMLKNWITNGSVENSQNIEPSLEVFLNDLENHVELFLKLDSLYTRCNRLVM